MIQQTINSLVYAAPKLASRNAKHLATRLVFFSIFNLILSPSAIDERNTQFEQRSADL